MISSIFSRFLCLSILFSVSTASLATRSLAIDIAIDPDLLQELGEISQARREREAQALANYQAERAITEARQRSILRAMVGGTVAMAGTLTWVILAPPFNHHINLGAALDMGIGVSPLPLTMLGNWMYRSLTPQGICQATGQTLQRAGNRIKSAASSCATGTGNCLRSLCQRSPQINAPASAVAIPAAAPAPSASALASASSAVPPSASQIEISILPATPSAQTQSLSHPALPSAIRFSQPPTPSGLSLSVSHVATPSSLTFSQPPTPSGLSLSVSHVATPSSLTFSQPPTPSGLSLSVSHIANPSAIRFSQRDSLHPATPSNYGSIELSRSEISQERSILGVDYSRSRLESTSSNLKQVVDAQEEGSDLLQDTF